MARAQQRRRRRADKPALAPFPSACSLRLLACSPARYVLMQERPGSASTQHERRGKRPDERKGPPPRAGGGGGPGAAGPAIA